jgi:hypothetical protein
MHGFHGWPDLLQFGGNGRRPEFRLFAGEHVQEAFLFIVKNHR